jgi:hypothetical protein
VEGISVTPFSEGALQRGLSGILVALIRLMGKDFNPNVGCEEVQYNHDFVKWVLEKVPAKAAEVLGNAEAQPRIEQEIKRKLDRWFHFAQQSKQAHTNLGYQQASDGRTKGLLRRPGEGHWDEFTCLMSLREVEPPVNLVLVDRGEYDD